MERTRVEAAKVGEEQKIRFKYIGGGSFWFLGHIIKENQVFWAPPSAIPEGFKDVILPVDGLPAADQPVIEGKPSNYTMRLKGNSTNLYEVVNEAGKVLNAKGLPKEKAEQLIKDLKA